MTTTVQTVFDQAIHLMDEQNEDTGATITADTGEYKSRTISILNSVIPRLYPFSSNYDTAATGRPKAAILLCSDYADPDFSQVIQLDDAISLTVLPYYLAAQLLSGENETLASWFLNLYREALSDIKKNSLGVFEPISTPYGLF